MADKNKFGISLDDASTELAYVVEEASNFMFSEFNEDWVTGEHYFAGKSNMPSEAGRSSMVKTEVRDIIRSLMPNVMRTLLHSRKPVVYTPNSIMTAAFAEQQSHWATQLFYREGGYNAIYSAVQESFKLKAGPIKTYWVEDAAPEYVKATGISAEELLDYQDQPDLVVEEVEKNEDPISGDITYDIEAVRYYTNGKITLQAFPIYEFFCERRADNLEDYVHGHRRTVKVSEAIEMGLEYEDWAVLDNDDPKANDAAEVDSKKRGYHNNQDDAAETDILNHEFLLTEAYCKYDMDGDGSPERYVFYLGGSNYKYLYHERIEDFCIDLVSHDPMPFTVIGRSICDITKSSQDTETSLLRAVIDNALMANNPRPAADPTKVNFNDLMNNAIGAPIRSKGRAEIQYADVPFTAQSLLPFMQYLEQDTQTRVGVTKAATGLDPDAMQSTDKQAVMNTIQLSQGQVELMVRNIVETGIIPVFRRLLRLSMRHMDKLQMIRNKGAIVPVDISRFDPYLVAEPNVGLGTASPEQKLQMLQLVYAEQQKYLMSMGMDNPFTSLSQIYNTLEDMIELGGLQNAGRYFNYIDKEIEAMIAEGMAKKAAEQSEKQEAMQPVDPGRSLLMAESMKSRVSMQKTMSDMRVKELELAQRSIEKAEEFDIARDKLVQDRNIKLAELRREATNETIKREQEANNPNPPRQQGGQGTQKLG